MDRTSPALPRLRHQLSAGTAASQKSSLRPVDSFTSSSETTTSSDGTVGRAAVVDEQFDPDLAGVPGDGLAVLPYSTALPVALMRTVRVPSPLSVTR